MSKEKIIPIFVPNYGCPHMCVFCNQIKITGTNISITKDEVIETIDNYLRFFNTEEECIIEIAFYGGSFTAIELSKQVELLQIAKSYKDAGKINKIRISTRPDAIDDNILKVLKSYSVDIIELGVQSLDKEVLFFSERGHSDSDVYDAVKIIRNYDFVLGLQMMVGLPGDDYDKSLNTLIKIIDLKPNFIRIYPTLVIKNTKLENMYMSGEYKPLTVDQTVKLCKDLLIVATYYKIPVIRIGLQTTEGIQLGKDVVSGPFHAAIRQLIESEIFYDIIYEALSNIEISFKGETLEIYCNANIMSNIAGHKSCNRIKLYNEFNFKIIKFIKTDMEKSIILKIGNIQKSIDIVECIENMAVSILDRAFIRGV
ncbi:elongator complex protein 3 [Soehngenia longivitae]|nr:radical SAM protein [Soehngenia longivitae]